MQIARLQVQEELQQQKPPSYVHQRIATQGGGKSQEKRDKKLPPYPGLICSNKAELYTHTHRRRKIETDIKKRPDNEVAP